MKKTNISKILNYLANDVSYPGTLSSRVAENRLNVSRLSSRIYELREAGFTIFTNSRKTPAGKVSVYRLHPSERKAARQVAAQNVGAENIRLAA